MEKIGFVLWESFTLLFVFLVALGVLIIRRKASGRPLFTQQDWLTYFGDLQLRMSKFSLALRLSYAAFLCSLVLLISNPLLPFMRAGLYTVTVVIICLGIVKLALQETSAPAPVKSSRAAGPARHRR